MSGRTMDDDQVTAYVDGELDASGIGHFERRLALEPALREAVAREQRLRERLRAAYAPVLDEAVPAHLSTLLQPPSATVIPLAQARERRAWGWAQWGGMAASLVLGALIGPRLMPTMTPAADPLVAQGALAQALDGALSGQSSEGVTPGLSFVAKDGGHYCRSFTLAGSQAGLACRDGGQWKLRQLMPLAPAPNAQYRMAATALPPALLESIDLMREGEALDAAAERVAVARGWKK